MGVGLQGCALQFAFCALLDRSTLLCSTSHDLVAVSVGRKAQEVSYGTLCYGREGLWGILHYSTHDLVWRRVPCRLQPYRSWASGLCWGLEARAYR